MIKRLVPIFLALSIVSYQIIACSTQEIEVPSAQTTSAWISQPTSLPFGPTSLENQDYILPVQTPSPRIIIPTITPYREGTNLEEVITPTSTITNTIYNRQSALEYALAHATRAVGDGFYVTMEDIIYPKFFLIGADSELPADSERYAGNDCAHFASYVLHMGGVEIPCSYNSSCNPYGIIAADSLFNHLIDNKVGVIVWEGSLQDYESDRQNIDLFLQERLNPGDLIFYAWEWEGRESFLQQHVAVYIGNKQVVSHTPSGQFEYLGTFGKNDDYHRNPFYIAVHISD